MIVAVPALGNTSTDVAQAFIDECLLDTEDLGVISVDEVEYCLAKVCDISRCRHMESSPAEQLFALWRKLDANTRAAYTVAELIELLERPFIS